MTSPRLAAGLAGLALVLVACGPGGAPVSPPSPPPSPTPTPSTSTSAASAAPATPSELPEPTTTNTLPPPPKPSAPAPSTAGDLDAAELPVPAGWRTAALKGGSEEGFRGNGTWVHARDPRYAAQDVITIGCADVTRDDYPDPVAALEGNYTDRRGAPGVGLALDFADAGAATRYWTRYAEQVRACETLDDPVHTEVVLAGDALVDRRTYPDGEWTEIGRRVGRRVTLLILSDDGHRITVAQARRVLGRIG
ncbi:MAG: hypothetical protein ACJ72G_13205 [Friedmanniella sp.]